MEKGKKSSKKVVKKAAKAIKKTPNYKERCQKYIYPSIVFGLMLAGFNYIFLILSLYSPYYSGIYMQVFDNAVLNVLSNTIFDLLLFGLSFFIVSYLFIEVVIGKHN